MTREKMLRSDLRGTLQAEEEHCQRKKLVENAFPWISSLEEGAALPFPWVDGSVPEGDDAPVGARLHQQQPFQVLG